MINTHMYSNAMRKVTHSRNVSIASVKEVHKHWRRLSETRICELLLLLLVNNNFQVSLRRAHIKVKTGIIGGNITGSQELCT